MLMKSMAPLFAILRSVSEFLKSPAIVPNSSAYTSATTFWLNSAAADMEEG